MKKRGEIYWIEKSGYEPEESHVLWAGRPGIIVSSDDINRGQFNYEVVLLTSSTPKFDKPTHVTIRSAREVSTAICEQVMTVSHEQVGGYIGTCSQEEMDAIDVALESSLALMPTVTSGVVWTGDNEQPAIEAETTAASTQGVVMKRSTISGRRTRN